ncbi:hypothetical protein [uncultured Adlercreutzia sp.]|uniref:hypothetical protein n=1 Tax=uncultured Adlercreutzia sp. TaxID=875803 RepID=UPI002675AE0F|nr:hypothetical protein [uncultured Adlercreutzia sp.]
MAMLPYPTNTLIFNIDDRVLDEPLKLALKRSWTHVGDLLVRGHAGEGEAPSNYLHVMVKFGCRPYLGAGEEADANWSERMEQHVRATLRKVSANLIAFNRNQRRDGKPELSLDYIEFSFENGALTLELLTDSNGAVPEECAVVATQVRAALNRGAIGEAVRVRVPAAASYAAQAAEAAEQAAAEEAERKAAAEEEAAGGEEAAEEVVFTEDPALLAEAEAQGEGAAEAVSPLEVAPLTEEEWEAVYGTPAVDFEVDYAIGEAIDADGASRAFVVATGEAVAA